MKSLGMDLLILALISAVVSALMLLPPRTLRRIEKNWGKIVFDDPVTFAQANRLSDVLVQANVFNGRDLTHRLTKTDETLIWSMMFQRNYEELFAKQAANIGPDPRQQLIRFVEEVCFRAFPDQRVKVELIGENLEPFEELLSPKVYRAVPVRRVESQ